jgi:glycosyltransferase involved in cell wall biosynthesis
MRNSDISIVYLWAEVTGYVHGVLRVLARRVQSIDVVHWDKRGVNSTQYFSIGDDNVQFHPRSGLGEALILEILKKRKPAIIVISGWMDKGYIRVCRKFKKSHPTVKIVAGIDDQWVGSLRQHVGILYFALFYRSLFDFMWVSGSPQYAYAQRFGYTIHNIIGSLYSADTGVFNEKASIARRFVYVGRFVKIKAADLLVSAYCKLPLELQQKWPLLFIGDGELKEFIISSGNPNIKVISFLQPAELRLELLKGGVACMPSHKDQWGVAVHEFALLGMPLLLSTGVGAATQFLIPGFNGFIFKKSNVDSLVTQMKRFAEMADGQIAEFGNNSIILGRAISNEVSASSLLSVLDREL